MTGADGLDEETTVTNQKETSILNATAALRKAWTEVDALIEDLERSLGEGRHQIRFGESKEKNFEDEGDVTAAFRWTFPVTFASGGRGAQRKLGELTVIIDMGIEKGIAVTLGRPVCAVVWGTKNHGWTDSFNDEGIAAIWPVKSSFRKVCKEGRIALWIGHYENGGDEASASLSFKDCAWYYIIPLFALSSATRLRELIVSPVRALLSDVDQDEALPQWTDGLFR